MLPSHLRFLSDMALSPPGELEEFYPETARGTLRPQSGERLFTVDTGRVTCSFIGSADGTIVPIMAENLDPMPENIWDARKFSTLVQATKDDAPVVYPGYADITIEHGEIDAQIRDGNHRTLAPIAAGAEFSWVLMSDRTVQDINDGNEALYKAIRAAQRAMGAPLFKRKKQGRVKEGKFDRLLEVEREAAKLRAQNDAYYRAMLQKHGPASGPWRTEDQKRRPQLFWRQRLKELIDDHGHGWVQRHVHGTKDGRQHRANAEQSTSVSATLYELRKEAGLQHGERLDPETGRIIRMD